MQDLCRVQDVSDVATQCRCINHRSNNPIKPTTIMISGPLAGYLLICLCKEVKAKYKEWKEKQ